MKYLSLILCLLGGIGLYAQPETDIYLFEVKENADGLELSEGKNITPRKGYDNQPFFTPDGQHVLYVAADSRGQTDVFMYDIGAGTAKRLTNTPKRSEYSPKVMPNGKHFSAVTVEEDSAQRLWYFPLEKEAYGKVLMPKVDSVGYYAWYHKKKVAMFVLTDPFTLQRSHKKRQKPKVITNKIGRSILMQAQTDTLSFVQKETEDDWYVKSWHPSTGRIKKMVRTLDGQEDFCWTPDGKILMGDGETLYVRDPYTDSNWKAIGKLDVGNFYRVAMSPDGKHLAVVAYKGEKP